MQDAKEEVRSRLNIEDVIGQYVQLKRAGRNFRGLSPFSAEKTPSFYVSPDKQIWHDFSSGKGGDVFSFIMEVEGMDFRASLEHLAHKAGVDLSMYETKGGKDIAERKKKLYLAYELAVNYYQQSLLKNQHAIDYVFKKRKLSKQIVTDFKIGYAPTIGDALTNFLAKKGFSRNELNDAGLLNQYGSDLFRGRMSVPLMDGTGRVIGFTGRIIVDDDKSPKYLNTPQTILYDKGRHVFGLSQAKETIRSLGYVVIVEGNLDVISSHQVGVKQVVATAGTAMTENHLKALVRLTNDIRLSFDGDKAGLAATERAIPIAQGVGVDLKIISLPSDVKDPDELIQKDAKLWQKAIDEAEPAIDWLLRQYSKREDLTTAIGKRRFTSEATKMIRLLSDSVEQEFYLQKVSEISGSSVDALKQKISIGHTEEVKSYKRVNTQTSSKTPDELSYQDSLLAISLIDNSVHELFKNIDPNIFIGEESQEIVKYFAESNNQTVDETTKKLQNFDIYAKISLLADTRYGDWNQRDRYFEAVKLLNQVTIEFKKKQKEILEQKIRDFEESGNDTEAFEIRRELNNIIKEIQNGQKK